MFKLEILERTHLRVFFTLLVFIIGGSLTANAQSPAQNQNARTFTLQNEQIHFTLKVQAGTILSETVSARKHSALFNNPAPEIKLNGDFALDVMWTDWQAPGMKNNAENPVLLSKNNFHIIGVKNSAHQLSVELAGNDLPILATIQYQLIADDFFIKKQVTVRDTSYGYHFLRRVYPLYSLLKGKFDVVKSGGFGQPVALENAAGGCFFGLEYPASQNSAQQTNNVIRISCSVEVGQKITGKPIKSGWAVIALTPSQLEKLWFSKYLERIRIMPLRPYTLYNSWYDLRSGELPGIQAPHVMNEKNILRIIDLIRKNFAEKNNIHLDAFVLDDGWDIHQSDWQLNKNNFPRGLQPIQKKLNVLNTKLGIWFGPVGGYDFRNERIDWMGTHGYEVVGKDVGNNYRMLCLAGKRYSQLFKKRTTQFVNKDGVRFFKWDGIQFSCSEPDHGHPIGIYSRRAVLDTLIALTKAVRAKHPDVFLNITSGTWLSPWWVQYANQIWMSGGDYGYSDVPSVSRRDAAMTYRDIVLYQDFRVNDFWMPIANLMTHGIIKGNLQKLGAKEPIDKFTNNALLYFARGVSMWELYISPDILTDDEWSAISQSLRWAEENFDILKHTEMVGGNPGAKEAYAYVHFNGNRGIIAARNPFIERKNLSVRLAPKYNVNPLAKDLVLERVYPTRWIDPQLHRAGDALILPLDGFETAVYRLYPLKETKRPLLAGAIFNEQIQGNSATIQILKNMGQVRLLNPNLIRSAELDGQKVGVEKLVVKAETAFGEISDMVFRKTKGNILQAAFTVSEDISNVRFLLLLEQPSGQKSGALPQVKIMQGANELKARLEKQDGQWAWYAVETPSGKVDLQIVLQSKKGLEG